jgi:hypothetical protein
MAEELIVEFTDTGSVRRRYRLERRPAGGWIRREEARRDGTWRPVGSEIVADVVVESVDSRCDCRDSA